MVCFALMAPNVLQCAGTQLRENICTCYTVGQRGDHQKAIDLETL